MRDRVIEDSKRSDYNWIACATELVRVCNKLGFPQELAQDIKLAILKCFTYLEFSSDGLHLESTDIDAVYSCFNSLKGTNENVQSVKHKFLKAKIKEVERIIFTFLFITVIIIANFVMIGK